VALADEQHGTVSFTKAAGHLDYDASTLTRLARSLSGKACAITGDQDAVLYKYDASARVAIPTDFGKQLAELYTQPVAYIDDAQRVLKDAWGQQGNDWSLRVVASQGLLEHHLIDRIVEVRNKLKRDVPQTAEAREAVAVKIYARGGTGAIKLLRARKCHLAYVGELKPGTIRETYPKLFADPPDSEATRSVPAKLLRCPDFPTAVNLYVPVGHRLLKNQALKEALKLARRGQKSGIRQALKIICDDDSPLILPGKWSVFRQGLEEHFEESGVVPKHIEEADTGRAIMAMVAASGMGKTIQQEVIVGKESELRSDIKCVSLAGVLQWHILVAYFQDYFLSRAARMLLESTTGAKLE